MILRSRLHTDGCVVFFHCGDIVHFVIFRGFRNKKTQSVLYWSRGHLWSSIQIQLASSNVHFGGRGPSKAHNSFSFY